MISQKILFSSGNVQSNFVLNVVVATDLKAQFFDILFPLGPVSAGNQPVNEAIACFVLALEVLVRLVLLLKTLCYWMSAI